MAYIPYDEDINTHKKEEIYIHQVEFYETEDGDTPVENFLNSLDIKMKNKLLMILSVLQEKGNMLMERLL